MHKIFSFKKGVYLFVLLCINSIFGQDIHFNRGWKFMNKDIIGAEAKSFSDQKWKSIDLPHDWAIEPFLNKKLKNKKQESQSIGWYRKFFKLEPEHKGKIIRVEFEGVMQHAQVWINGVYIGENTNGYLGFEYDITPYINFEEEEFCIAVKVTAPKTEIGTYAGAGVHRSVWLRLDNPTYIDTWGTYIKTTSLSDDLAIVENETTIINKRDTEVKLVLIHKYFTKTGLLVAETEDKVLLKPNSKAISETYTRINYPLKWTTKKPNIYNVVTTISENEKRIDSYLTRIGLRTISYGDNKLYINGKSTKFKGVGLADDNGLLGLVGYRATYERKLKLLKKMGANAVKVNGHPPAREFLELCDELGFLVVDESFNSWKIEELEQIENIDFKDLKQLVLRDRNHPSVVVWNMDNEYLENYPKQSFKLAKSMRSVILRKDVTRPIALSFGRKTKSFEFNLAQQAPFSGINYSPKSYSDLLEKHPQNQFYASKTSGVKTVRGFYPSIENYPEDSYLDTSSSYPPDIEFHYQEENPEWLGGFVWSGLDGLDIYGNRKNYTTHFGQADICGFPKDNFYFYKARWTKPSMLYLSPHWDWQGKEGNIIPVTCFTNCEEAELFLNGKSLGKKSINKDFTKIDVNRSFNKTFNSKYRLSWNVPYRKGRLKVIGYQSGVKMAEHYIDTSGKPIKVLLSTEKKEVHGKDDLIYIEAKIVDKVAKVCPNTDNLIHFSVKGNAKIIAIDNGVNADGNYYNTDKKRVHKGMCLVILKPTGTGNAKEKIEVIAKSSGLTSGKLRLSVK